MPSSLTELFADITRGLNEDRDSLNALDQAHNGNAGDNMVFNFETITDALRQADQQNAPVDQALNFASQMLRQSGKGKTAEMYANGLAEAANSFQGKQNFGIGDIATLLNGLLGGVQNTPGVRSQGGGGMLDGLLPGVMGFMQSKNSGGSLLESLFKGYMASQRGAFGTTGSESGFGSSSGRNTRGQVDPGAAAASSLLGSLFNSLLSNGLKAGSGNRLPSSGLEDLFGGLGGLGGMQQQQPRQQQQDPYGGMQGGGGLGELFGQLFGGGGMLGGGGSGGPFDQPSTSARRGQGSEPRARISGEESM